MEKQRQNIKYCEERLKVAMELKYSTETKNKAKEMTERFKRSEIVRKALEEGIKEKSIQKVK